MKKYLAEFLGTFTLVLFGCGAAVLAGDRIGSLGIALAFGFAFTAMAYGIGPLSGCHLNPAVSLGMYTAGRMTGKDLGSYIIAQLLGAIAGAAVLLLIATGHLGGYDLAARGLGQNGWGDNYGGEYNIAAAIVFEFIASLLFVIVFLGATQAGVPTELAGVAIGIALTGFYLVGLPLTGASLNPARSLGPALFAGGRAISQLWLFLVVPSIAGIVSGWLYRSGILAKEHVRPRVTEVPEQQPMT
ncbi:aquaporin [Hydrococcus rivularis NIES-593]|uniref:Aquaporin n=1 Tax=Hydrococcus rivularis NIES-593 TaxID=1921803 RepID=A0A1U7HIQ7_9CYAN|nr:aquaporin [Hydrococcus rivularis NIES-593]